jgi:hypothetical protein
MITTSSVRRITYTSNTTEETTMDPMRLIIDKQTSERLQEATDNRLFRASPADNDELSRPGWPTRARRRLGDSLVAAGETLRSSPDERPAAHENRVV